MSKRLDYFIDRVLVCGSISLAIGAMTGLEKDYSIYVSLFLFIVLMLFSASVAPKDDAEYQRLLTQASLLASQNNCESVDGGDS